MRKLAWASTISSTASLFVVSKIPTKLLLKIGDLKKVALGRQKSA